VTSEPREFCRARIAALLAALFICVAWNAYAAPPLHGYSADVSRITVSGLSSGGYMAVQLHVSHSATVKGAAIFAAGPYYCAGGHSWTAYYNCMTPGALAPLPALSKLHAVTEALAKEGRIDPTRHLADARVWLFSGTHDETVSPEVVNALAGYYARYVDPKQLTFVRDRPAGHAVVSADADVKAACGVTKRPFINRCTDERSGSPYDAAGALLAYLLGSAPSAPQAENGEIVAFDQRPFAGGSPHSISLSDVGYAYVPAVCRTERCRVHIAFHGCAQSEESVGQAFIRDAGYNRWADVYRLIVLYPQTISRNGWGGDLTFVMNPKGCWDWWGYTGADYHTKAGPQIRAVKAMVDRIGEAR